MDSLPNPSNLRRIHFGFTGHNGQRTHRDFVKNADNALVAQSAPQPPETTDETEPIFEPVSVPPALVLEPVRIPDFVALLTCAHAAERALDRFIQLQDPTGTDLRTLERLRTALSPFFPAPVEATAVPESSA